MNDAARRDFGTMPDGRAVEQYTLRAGELECDIITYGGALRALRVPDRDGRALDVLLGFDRLEDYRNQDKYIGALVGRFANRIGGSRFTLNGKEYPLYANNGANHLHGGKVGFDKQVWDVKDASRDTLTLALFSPDGQEGYPGSLSVQVTYALTGDGLSISYQAQSDRDTLCNLTNHAYFNLAGHDSGPIADHMIQIFADRYTPADAGSIPTGEIAPVEGTPMDLRQPVDMAAHWDEPFRQLELAGGYDHNWAVNGESGVLRPAARVLCTSSGVELDMLTTSPGVQFYSGNYVDGCPAGKGGAPYGKRWGFCLEAQLFPDAPHHGNFPSALLPAGAQFRHRTVYQLKQT